MMQEYSEPLKSMLTSGSKLLRKTLNFCFFSSSWKILLMSSTVAFFLSLTVMSEEETQGVGTLYEKQKNLPSSHFSTLAVAETVVVGLGRMFIGLALPST